MKNWSKELPKKTGFYFCRELNSGYIVIYELVHSCNGELEWMEMGWDVHIEYNNLRENREWMEVKCPVEGYIYDEKYLSFKKEG